MTISEDRAACLDFGKITNVSGTGGLEASFKAWADQVSTRESLVDGVDTSDIDQDFVFREIDSELFECRICRLKNLRV